MARGVLSSSGKDGWRLETKRLRVMWLNAEVALNVMRSCEAAMQTGTARAAKPATAVNSTGKGGSRSGKAALVSALRFLTALMKEMTNLVLPWWRWARLKVAV